MKIFIFYFLEVGKVQGVAIFCLETGLDWNLQYSLFWLECTFWGFGEPNWAISFEVIKPKPLKLELWGMGEIGQKQSKIVKNGWNLPKTSEQFWIGLNQAKMAKTWWRHNFWCNKGINFKFGPHTHITKLFWSMTSKSGSSNFFGFKIGITIFSGRVVVPATFGCRKWQNNFIKVYWPLFSLETM